MPIILVDWSGGWATPWGSASQMRPWSVAKRLIGRPQESAQPERKSTTRYENVALFFSLFIVASQNCNKMKKRRFLCLKMSLSSKQ